MAKLQFLGAAAAIGALAVPVAAQTSYPQQYPQQYPQTYPQQQYPQQQYPQQQYPQQQYPQQQYPQQQYPQGYGYPNQGYGTNVIQQVIDQLLGNRYSATDRTAVSRCASAALAQAQSQHAYSTDDRGYAQPYAYGQDTYSAARMRVTEITDVQRRSSGLRVRGLIDSGAYDSHYANPYGNQPNVYPRYARTGDLTFRCDVDYRGYISNVRIGHNNAYRPY